MVNILFVHIFYLEVISLLLFTLKRVSTRHFPMNNQFATATVGIQIHIDVWFIITHDNFLEILL